MREMDADMVPFLALHLHGERFDAEPGMPVETLGELVAYRDLVVEVAKHLFRRSHPGRKRVPKGFTDSFRLRMRRVHEGSAVPLLERPVLPGLLAIGDEFDFARDLISDAIAATAAGQPLPQTFPRHALVYFNRFGQGLRDDESIELRSPDTTSGPRYTQDVRKRLVLDGQPRYQREWETIGHVIEIDAEKKRFQLRLEGGAMVLAPIDTVMFDDVKEALAPVDEGSDVRVSGIGVFDPNDRLLFFDSVHELTAVESDDYDASAAEALSHIEGLEAGWLDGDSMEADKSVLERTRSLLGELLRRSVPAPRLYPVPDGGVQAEWTLGPREVSITVEPGGTIYMIAVDAVSGDTRDATLSTDDPDPIVRLVLNNAS